MKRWIRNLLPAIVLAGSPGLLHAASSDAPISAVLANGASWIAPGCNNGGICAWHSSQQGTFNPTDPHASYSVGSAVISAYGDNAGIVQAPNCKYCLGQPLLYAAVDAGEGRPLTTGFSRRLLARATAPRSSRRSLAVPNLPAKPRSDGNISWPASMWRRAGT